MANGSGKVKRLNWKDGVLIQQKKLANRLRGVLPET